MGHPVVHFEVIGSDGDRLRAYYSEVPDIDAAMDKAERLGGTRMSEPDEVPGQGIKIAHIADPEGHTIGLLSSTD